MDKHRLEGSYTIELTLLTPFIIAVFLFIFFSSYYAHDRVIIERSCYAAALRGAACPENINRQQVAMVALEKELNNRLLAHWELNSDIDVTSEGVTVSINGTMKMNEGLLLNIISDRIFAYESSCEAYICDNEKALRGRRKKG